LCSGRMKRVDNLDIFFVSQTPNRWISHATFAQGSLKNLTNIDFKYVLLPLMNPDRYIFSCDKIGQDFGSNMIIDCFSQDSHRRMKINLSAFG
jgi:hypothetical protein